MFQTYNIRLAFLCFAFLAHGGFYIVDARSSLEGKTARKFDEFKAGYDKRAEEEARRARFARQLRQEPQTKAYIIAYSPRIRNRSGSNEWGIAVNHLRETEGYLRDRLGIREDRIITVDGGIREDAMVEYWILPAGAKPPPATPEFQTSDVVECCNLQAHGAMYVFKKDTPLTFKVTSSGSECRQATSYRWNTSSGRIVNGQGSNTLTVDASATTDGRVIATVDAEGLSAECINRAESTTTVGVVPYKLSEFEENFSEALKVWGDHLGVILQQNQELRGHLIVYGARNEELSYAAYRLAWAQNYLINSRGVAARRLSGLVGGYRERLMFEYWLVSPGTQVPRPTPSVDEIYARPRARTRTRSRRR